MANSTLELARVQLSLVIFGRDVVSPVTYTFGHLQTFHPLYKGISQDIRSWDSYGG